ncbi:uncharacterized protein CIMG_13435 [Coccidioides immitis RS]|uniref:Uncharacterized protein n=1 Tax=Coccidioides immitis (strain RS) TaxID=246410 RepID=A0A0E1RZ81_COCIM|nr:uncharacterized protein CIMG_13435 [Coccidioides immitis RS]EAS34173.2 hypothetical protein CIMG_13435 [Coccidioides immitis RS]
MAKIRPQVRTRACMPVAVRLETARDLKGFPKNNQRGVILISTAHFAIILPLSQPAQEVDGALANSGKAPTGGTVAYVSMAGCGWAENGGLVTAPAKGTGGGMVDGEKAYESKVARLIS